MNGKRWNAGSVGWLALMVGTWIAFGVGAIWYPDTLTDFWHWGQRLPLAAEAGLWIGTLPWMLALAVLHTAWADWLQIALISGFAGAWVLVSIPKRVGERPRRTHLQLPSWESVVPKGLRHSH